MTELTENNMEKYTRHFMKIMLLNDMSTDIASFGEQQGSFNLMERVDLTCGAIPSNEFSQAIDPSAPEQFLELYSHVAEYRFAFAVVQLLKLNPAYMTALKNYCTDKGKALKAETVPNVETAYGVMDFCILDGMPDTETKHITEHTPGKLVWEKLQDTHEDFWNKAGGSVETYYQLVTCFVEGLLDGSNIVFKNEKNQVFSLETAR